MRAVLWFIGVGLLLIGVDGRDIVDFEVLSDAHQEVAAEDIDDYVTARSKRDAPQNLVIDLLTVVDYSTYKKWSQLSGNDRDKTIENLRFYLAHVLNGVNNVYQSMQSSRYKISVNLVSIYIAETAQNSMFTEDSSIHSSQDWSVMNFNKALENIQKWAVEKTPQNGEQNSASKFLAPHDIITVLTDYQQASIAGLAYVRTICSEMAASIVRASGQGDIISTWAHEMGHVLGCDHDEPSFNDCPTGDYYVMTPSLSISNIQNRFTLSRCSVRYIEDTIGGLRDNCLDPSKKNRRTEDLSGYLNTLPGVLYSADQQCKIIFDKDNIFCSTGGESQNRVCSELSCYKDDKCMYKYPLALDGTMCGNAKWCIKGQCVAGGRTDNNIRDDCVYGDMVRKINFNGQLMSCKELRNKHSYCYSLDKVCCETCYQIKKERGNDDNCPYGDKGMTLKFNNVDYGCDGVFQYKPFCDNPMVVKNCCESCARAQG